jgi:hypothetical protein
MQQMKTKKALFYLKNGLIFVSKFSSVAWPRCGVWKIHAASRRGAAGAASRGRKSGLYLISI